MRAIQMVACFFVCRHGDGATSAMGTAKHSGFQSRSRLHGRPNFEHGFSDRPGREQVARCNPTRRPRAWSAESALQRTAFVHGVGYSPDSKTLAVVSVGSNSVTLIDTVTNKVKGTVYVGRSPHEAFFTPNGRELWVTVRGENYVSVIDPAQMKETRRIELANGPGMTMFGPDGKYAFVCSSFTPELAVIDVASHKIVKRLPQVSPFSPNIAVTPENDEVWITLKDVGKVQIYSAKPPFDQKAVLDTGPITNHVNFANNRNGKFAYVTIGGANEVKAFRRGATPELVATIPVGEFRMGSGRRAMAREFTSR